MNRILSTTHLTPFRRPLAGLSLALPALSLLALAPLAAWPADEGPELSQPAGEPALESIRAEDLSALLERNRGKVILVNFWATWCGPCIHEIPALLNLKNKLSPYSFALIPISVDDPVDSSWLVEEFIQTRFPNWYSYLSAEIEDYLMVEEIDPHWPGVLPANYLIAPDGKLAKTLLGGHTEEKFEEAIRAVMSQR